MNSAVKKWVSGVACSVAVVVTSPAAAVGQGNVAGQISIQEKPGEQTTDLGNTVVWLEPASGSRAHPAPTNSQMSMDGRKFSPHLRVVTPGSKVDFPNQDPFSHNIFSSADGGAFDLGLYGRGESKSTTFAKAGAYPIYCNIHARMTGFIVVVSTTLYTLAGNDGRYLLEKAPPGRYVLHVWHERAPEVTKDVSVGANGASGMDVPLDARGFKFVAHKNKFGQDYKAVGERY